MQSCWQVTHGGTFVILFCCRCHRWLQLQRASRASLSHSDRTPALKAGLQIRAAAWMFHCGSAGFAWGPPATPLSLSVNYSLLISQKQISCQGFLVLRRLHHLSSDSLTAAAWFKLFTFLRCCFMNWFHLVNWSTVFAEWVRSLCIKN